MNDIVKRSHKAKSSLYYKWEWQLFFDICNTGKKYGVLTSDIKPNAFADMFQMLLKALEILFFAKNEYEHSKSTYESMIYLLIK